MSTDSVVRPQPSPAVAAAPAPGGGRRAASAVVSSVLLLFGLAFAPLSLVAAASAEPLGSEWSTGSNFVNVVVTWMFAVAMLMLTGLGVVAIVLARTGRSTGLVIFAAAVTLLLLLGAVGMITAAAIMVSG